jgi:choline dehydrogenase
VTAAPLISLNFLSTDKDRAVAVQSIKQAREIMDHMDPKYRAREVRPGAQLTSDDELIRGAGDIGTTIFHPAGSTKMGLPSDPSAVVDSRLKVLGIRNLRIADCGIMPTIVSGNTSSPTMAIGGRCAELIVADRI